jgi:tetratricopeptide (TPR) repeat protein
MDSVVSRIVTTLNVDTVTPRKYTQIANTLAGNGYYREALSIIENAVKIEPKYYLTKAIIEFNAGFMDEAIVAINKYITCQKKISMDITSEVGVMIISENTMKRSKTIVKQ